MRLALPFSKGFGAPGWYRATGLRVYARSLWLLWSRDSKLRGLGLWVLSSVFRMVLFFVFREKL